jgi:hypothetical protein
MNDAVSPGFSPLLAQGGAFGGPSFLDSTTLKRRHVQPSKPEHSYLKLLPVIVLLGLLLGSLVALSRPLRNVLPLSTDVRQTHRSVLIVYAFSSKSLQQIDNLANFLNNGVSERDDHTYLLVDKAAGTERPVLPRLPKNAWYLQYGRHMAQECFDWGTYGLAIGLKHVNGTSYDYYIFISATARGPYMPAYAKVCNLWAIPRTLIAIDFVGSFSLRSL